MDSERLHTDLHVSYIKSLYSDKMSYEYQKTANLRMSAIYWAVTALDMLGSLEVFSKDEILEFVGSCYNPYDGGYGASQDHDSHILYTLSAIQLYAIFDALDQVPRDAVANFVSSLQGSNGEFMGDEWGEVDTRFSYCAAATLRIIGRMDAINLQAARNYIIACRNPIDGGYGVCKEAESHAGMVFCCVGALSIIDGYAKEMQQPFEVDEAEKDLNKTLSWWLSERQLPCGGFNGRPEKLEDICYSWWVLSSLKMLGCEKWINEDSLKEFIFSAQDLKNGGIAARPDMPADVFHTLFGICGLSMLNLGKIKPVNPIFCLPQYVTDRLNIDKID